MFSRCHLGNFDSPFLSMFEKQKADLIIRFAQVSIELQLSRRGNPQYFVRNLEEVGERTKYTRHAASK